MLNEESKGRLEVHRYSSGNKKFRRNSKYYYEYSRNSEIPKVEMRVIEIMQILKSNFENRSVSLLF